MTHVEEGLDATYRQYRWRVSSGVSTAPIGGTGGTVLLVLDDVSRPEHSGARGKRRLRTL
jgi:hypothetical protein